MLRDPNLVPLSRQHQHALALCVRIDRGTQADPVDLEAWQSEIQQLVDQEIATHFAAEEAHIFPAARRFLNLQSLVDELQTEHAVLRGFFSQAASRTLDRESLRQMGAALSRHIRKEERQLFERMQDLLSAEDLARLGESLERSLGDPAQACILPGDATRLRPR